MSSSLRMHAVQAPIIPTVAALIREHPGTISLGQGIVHYAPPPETIARIEACLSDPRNHSYGEGQSLPALKSAIAAKLADENGIEVRDLNRIMITAGSNMGFYYAVLAIAEPGDEFILPAPYYFNHEMAVTMAGCRSVPVPTDADYHLQHRLLEDAITPRTRAIVTVSPNNPTSAVYSQVAQKSSMTSVARTSSTTSAMKPMKRSRGIACGISLPDHCHKPMAIHFHYSRFPRVTASPAGA